MSIARFETNARMSQAVVHGNTVYLAGQVAQKAAGKGVTEQMTEILATIDKLLAQAGSDKSKLLQAHVYLTDIKTFAEMNKVWEAWVVPGQTPARVTIECNLAAPQYNAEVMVVAAK
jgi:enamine deaminase RidA (YjgF/YER057c/UK114 family)